MSHHAIIPAAGLGRRMGDDDRKPKCLLPLAGRPMLLYTLDALAARNAARATLIVGYRREQVMSTVGTMHNGMPVDYVDNVDFATTEHGWSLYLSRERWLEQQRPVLFIDADNVFDPRLLDRLLASPAENSVLVDPELDTTERDEELVLGSHGQITGFVRGRAPKHDRYVGGFVGMNRFSPQFMRALYAFMQNLFAGGERGFKYERVFHKLLSTTRVQLEYLSSNGFAWVNVNHPHEIRIGERIVASEHAEHAEHAE